MAERSERQKTSLQKLEDSIAEQTKALNDPGLDEEQRAAKEASLENSMEIKALVLYDILWSEAELSNEETAFLQIIALRLKAEENGSRASLGRNMERKLNNDGKLSESEVEMARGIAGKISDLGFDLELDNITQEEYDAALAEVLEDANERKDVVKLTQAYIDDNYQRTKGIRSNFPDEPENGTAEEIREFRETKNEMIDELLDYKKVTGVDFDKDPNLRAEIERLEAKIVDDMKPYGNTDALAPTTPVSASDEAQGAAKK